MPGRFTQGDRVKRITIFDYGAGNLHSLVKVLAKAEAGPARVAPDVRIESNPVTAIETDLLVLPGVGAFAHAAARLQPGVLVMREAIQGGLPTLGICLGMQLLFSHSEEGEGEGLGVITGTVRKLRSRRIPHIGWNDVTPELAGSTSRVWPGEKMMYFANGYVCEPDDPSVIIARTTHESDRFVSVVAQYRTVGVQFHPEKSSTEGVAFVHNFVRGVLQ